MTKDEVLWTLVNKLNLLLLTVSTQKVDSKPWQIFQQILETKYF